MNNALFCLTPLTLSKDFRCDALELHPGASLKIRKRPGRRKVCPRIVERDHDLEVEIIPRLLVRDHRRHACGQLPGEHQVVDRKLEVISDHALELAHPVSRVVQAISEQKRLRSLLDLEADARRGKLLIKIS